MKKVFSYILMFVLVFSLHSLVKADTLTFDEVANKFRTSNTYKTLTGSGIGIDIANSSNTIDISYPGGDLRKTIFNYNNGIITYTFNASKNDQYTMSRTKLDAQWIVLLLQIVSESKGYDVLDLQTLTLAKLKQYNLEENGIEVTTFRYTYKNPENDETIETSGYDTFKIDINNLDLKIEKVDDNDSEELPEEEIITEVIPKEKPENITIKDIAELLPGVLKKIYGNQFGEIVAENSSNFSVEYNYNTLTIFQEIDKKKEILRTLTVDNGIITHDYIYDTELGIDGERILNIFIYKGLFMSIGEIYGYSEKELDFLYKNFFEATFDESGYELKTSKERSNFKVDINRFNLEKVEEEKEEENEAPIIENNENNNNNGVIFVIMIIIVIVSICVLFYINRDMFGNMLRNKYRR